MARAVTGARDAYRRWSAAPLSEETDVFHTYVAALDNEEDAANHYAELILRLSQQASSRPRNQRNQRRWRPTRS